MELIFNKSSFNIDKINSEFENFCTLNNINNENLLNLQLVNEEFLSNILFPNFEGDVKLTIFQVNNSIALSFEYSGVDYMNKINETTIISFKILQNKTKEINSDTLDNKTTVSFII